MLDPITIEVPSSLDEPALVALEASIDAAAARPSGPWCLRGTPAVFCRGISFAALTVELAGADAAVERFARVLAKLRGAPGPTIAVLEGEALGGGVGLAAACDRVIATPRATVGLPEALFGVLPAVIWPVLCERASPQRLRLLALDGLARDAEWALAAGLFDELVTPTELPRALRRATLGLSRVSRGGVLGLRGLAEQSRALPLAEALAKGAAITAALLRDDVVRGSLRRFADEGVPPWQERS